MTDRNKGDDPTVTATPRASSERRANEGSAFNFDARRDTESVPELVRDLVHQGSQLAEQQTRLVQAEVRSAIGELTTAAGAMAGAAVVAIAGLGVLLMGVSFLLAQAMPLWAATLLVAVATMIVAYAMFAGGRKKLQDSSVNMERTRHTIERAPSAISGNPNEGHNHGR